MHIRLDNICKNFGKVKANRNISLTVGQGTIHAVLGENGAGKSTLMKILAGYISKTSGGIYIDGQESYYRSPHEASRLGVGMLYQDPLDFPQLTVLENYMLGRIKGVRYSTKSVRSEIEQTAKRFNFSLHPDDPVRRLTIGERQQLNLLRLFASGVRCLILDEPTTGISGVQKEILFAALRTMAGEGKSIILVSHKIEEVETLCDSLTVLRQGEVVGEAQRPFDVNSVLQMMFGEPPVLTSRSSSKPGHPVLEMANIQARGGRSGLHDCNVVVRGGEVVGLAGLEGSGQGVFLRVAAGLNPPVRGDIRIKGVRMNGKPYNAFKKTGTTFLPASRLEEGLIPGFTLIEHSALQNNASRFFVNWRNAALHAENQIRDFKIAGYPESPAESLSGGNQQRLLLSFLPAAPYLLLLENPTRGLDLESTNWVWKYLQSISSDQTAIVFTSPETDEILMMSDRILVFFEGGIIMDVKTRGMDTNLLSRAIAGKSAYGQGLAVGEHKKEALA